MPASLTPPCPSERHLAAILAADIVGYSRLMGEDEEATGRDVKRRLGACAELAKRFAGRVVGTAGDGILCEFASAVRAVECAISIQKMMAVLNAEVPVNRRMLFRIGINLGDIVHDQADIYGDGVNVAVRLEAICEPGGLCLSRDARNQVRDKLTYPFSDLGEHRVKNIARPVKVFALSREVMDRLPAPPAPARAGRMPWRALIVAAVLLTICAGAVFLVRHQASERLPAGASAAAAGPAIAVLPFMALTGEGSDGYLVDGLTEDVIAALGRYPELPVLSRSAVFAYKGSTAKTTDIARDLGASYVVVGSVRRTPEALRVAVELSDAGTGKLLWSEHYEAKPNDLPAIENSIVRDIAGSLAARLVKLEQARVAAKPAASLEAYDLVLRGRELEDRQQRAANIAAQTMFQRAAALDPSSAAAFIGLGQVELNAADWGWREDPIATAKTAESYARKALELAPDDPSAHALLGRIHAVASRPALAVDELRRAIELNPSDAENYQSLAEALIWLGDVSGSIEASRLALHFNPNLSAGGLATLGLALFLSDHQDEAVNALERATSRDPAHFLAQLYLAAAYAGSSRLAEAKTALARARALNPTLDFAGLASGFQRLEHRRSCHGRWQRPTRDRSASGLHRPPMFIGCPDHGSLGRLEVGNIAAREEDEEAPLGDNPDSRVRLDLGHTHSDGAGAEPRILRRIAIRILHEKLAMRAGGKMIDRAVESGPDVG